MSTAGIGEGHKGTRQGNGGQGIQAPVRKRVIDHASTAKSISPHSPATIPLPIAGVALRLAADMVSTMCEARGTGAIGPVDDEELERDYAAYLECFNNGGYYEAHDALEPLWLRVRGCAVANLLKGLIQLAGAFVHVQKGRLGPARALLGRARFHLEPFVTASPMVDVPTILGVIGQWELRVGSAGAGDQLLRKHAPPALPESRAVTR